MFERGRRHLIDVMGQACRCSLRRVDHRAVPPDADFLTTLGGVAEVGQELAADVGRALFAGIRAPSTLGTLLRSFTHGHALQFHAAHRGFLAALAAHTPLLPGSGEKAFIDVDSTHKRVYERAKQGAEYGRFKGIRTLHPLLATVCTPHSRR
ncbi:hypothetical protein ACFRQM_13575 [Streptomyces sp. NPDC056831]|uniref:hypothetical protein n=1 Tax=Streptomyces sp. NPDC056831 TaxID=3345954 RepID=UPI0036BD0EA7